MRRLANWTIIFIATLVFANITFSSGCSQPSATTTTEIAATTTTEQTTTEAPATTTTEAPTTTTEARKEELELEIISVTSPVSPGAFATLSARVTPGATCDITVIYKSGPSEAAGLFPKTAGSDGRVSWTWKVGTRTTPGTWDINVTASLGGETVTESTTFVVQ